MDTRPSFIVSAKELPETAHVYPQSSERMGPVRHPGRVAGLLRIGINLQRLPSGTRSSWPHAEENEEEFVYVLEGEVDAWIDGDLHRMTVGDLAAFPAGTGICHCFINPLSLSFPAFTPAFSNLQPFYFHSDPLSNNK